MANTENGFSGEDRASDSGPKTDGERHPSPSSFRYACFISYRSPQGNALGRFAVDNLRVALSQELELRTGLGVYLDDDRLQGGELIESSITDALCKSVCMLLVYWNNYFDKSRPYCAREYRAMEELERIRQSYLSRASASPPPGLIIPVVIRGERSMPSFLRARKCWDFQSFFLTEPRVPLAKKGQYHSCITGLADYIEQRCLDLWPHGEEILAASSTMRLPNTREVAQWLTEVLGSTIPASPPDPFPLRGAQAHHSL